MIKTVITSASMLPVFDVIIFISVDLRHIRRLKSVTLYVPIGVTLSEAVMLPIMS